MTSPDDPAAVTATITALHGAEAIHEPGRVAHVVAVAEEPGGRFRVIAIGPRAPRSETDAFVLAWSRARADVIVTTGAILRAEPQLRYDLPGPRADALLAWREAVLGRPRPPRVVVLTRGERLPATHPTWESWAEPWVLTGAQATLALPPRVAVLREAEPGLEAAVAWAQAQGARTVSLEVGPRTARAMYRRPAGFDELLLSVYEGPLHPEAAGDLLTDLPTLRAIATRRSVCRLPQEPLWRFERWTAAPDRLARSTSGLVQSQLEGVP